MQRKCSQFIGSKNFFLHHFSLKRANWDDTAIVEESITITLQSGEN